LLHTHRSRYCWHRWLNLRIIVNQCCYRMTYRNMHRWYIVVVPINVLSLRVPRDSSKHKSLDSQFSFVKKIIAEFSLKHVNISNLYHYFALNIKELEHLPFFSGEHDFEISIIWIYLFLWTGTLNLWTMYFYYHICAK
jgi:hypothetical protein